MTTRVVSNRSHAERDPNGRYIGRPTVYGNPFVIGVHGSRLGVIALYRTWFAERIQDPEFREQVELLRGRTLVCYCAPLPCHGDVIAEWLDSVQ